MVDPASRATVAAVWRIESARIVGALARYTGDFALAEDLAQEALAEALVTWSRDGVPRNPAGWLLTVGRRRAIDGFRRRAALDDRHGPPARRRGGGGRRPRRPPRPPPAGPPPPPPPPPPPVSGGGAPSPRAVHRPARTR
ncbi:sigma factor, partial [Nocardia wallacei]|uniref:sigma factor n=1 Tax=Nocardia wallacei TaxID=480035 RepID=UPI002456B1DD